MIWTHPVRIYRCGFTQNHDLSITSAETDIYEKDVWGRILPDDDAIIVPNEWGVVGGSGKIVLPVGYDVSPGYILWVKDAVVWDGKRQIVGARLTKAASAGAVALQVDNIRGFNDGTIMLITDGGGEDTPPKYHRAKLRYATGNTLTLYDENRLVDGYPAESVVYSGKYWRVTGRKGLGGWGRVQEFSIVEIPFAVKV